MVRRSLENNIHRVCSCSQEQGQTHILNAKIITMSKIKYLAPDITVFVCDTTQVLMASQLNTTDENQSIIPTEEEYSEEFQSRGMDVWDDEEDF